MRREEDGVSGAYVKSQDADHAARGDANDGGRHANGVNMKMRGRGRGYGIDGAGTLRATQASPP